MITVNRQLAGWDDITWGTGTEEQDRLGIPVTVTQINAAIIPFDETRTLGEVFDDIGDSETAAATSAAAALVSENNASDSEDAALVSELAAEVHKDTAVAASISAESSSNVAAALANIDYSSFTVVDGELIVSYVDLANSVPSLVDGEFILTYA